MGNLRPYTKEQLEELCKESISYKQVLEKAGRKYAGGNQSNLKKKIKEFNIDVSHFKGQAQKKGLTVNDHPSIKGKTDEEIFVKNSDAYRQSLRKRVLAHNLIEYKCVFCGNIGKWLNQELTLELDHIDGDTTNNQLSNLRWLCPNCHSLTPTWRTSKREKINTEDMLELEDNPD